MSDKIKKAHDDAPTAGSDPTDDGYVAVGKGGSTAIGYSFDQLSNVVSDRLDLGSNSGNPSAFSMTLGDDTFNAVIAPVTGAGEYWIIQVDDSTTPTSGGTQGTIPTQYTVTDTDIHTYTLFTSSDDATYTEVTPEQTLQYNDTQGPVISTATTYLLEAGTDPATQIKVTVPTATDVTGVDRVDLYDAITGKPFQLDLTLGAITEIDNLTPGASYTWYLRYIDTVGNISTIEDPNNVGEVYNLTLTTSSTVANGVVDFTAIAFEDTEGAGPLEATLRRQNRTNTIAQTVTVTVIDRTTVDGGAPTAVVQGFDTITDIDAATENITWTGHGYTAVNDDMPVLYSNKSTANPPVAGSDTVGLTDGDTYYFIYVDANTIQLSATVGGAAVNISDGSGGETHRLIIGGYEVISSQLVSWGTTDDANKTVYVEMPDNASLANNMFEIQIDDGSESTGAQGSNVSALCKVLSSVPGVAGYQQSSATGNVLCVEAENMTSFADSGSVVYTEVNEEASGEDSNGKHMLCGEGTWGDATTYEADAPYLQATVNFVATGIHDIWLRMRANDSDNHVCHTNLDDAGAPNATQLGFDGPIVGTDVNFYGTRKWIHKRADGTNRTVDVTTSGSHTIEIYGQQRKSRVDKIVYSLASDSYDPSTAGVDGPNAEDDKLGPDESAYSAGSIEDNPNNPITPSTPPPAGTVTATYSPLDAATDVATSTVFVATFTGKTVLTSTTATVTLDGGSDISGTVTVGVDSITFTPASPLGEGNKYLPVFTGTIRDTDGSTKSYDTTNWDVTVVTGSSAVFFENFNSQPLGPMTNSLLETIFNANTADGGYGGVENMDIVTDPEVSGVRDRVLRITHPANQYELGCSFKCRFSADNTNKTGSERHKKIWLKYDVYYSANTEFQSAMKTIRLGAGTLLEMSHSGDNVPSVDPEGVYAFNAGVNLYNNGSYPAIPADEAALYHYRYTSNYLASTAQQANACNTDDPTVGIDGALAANVDKLQLVTRAGWHTVLQIVDLNTAPTWSDTDAKNDGGQDAGIINDATDEIYFDGVKVFDRDNIEYRWTDALLCDGFWFYEYYNARNTTPPPSEDQYVYYDNIHADSSAITP